MSVVWQLQSKVVQTMQQHLNFSGYAGHVTIFSWLFTIACCLVVEIWLGLGSHVVSGCTHVFVLLLIVIVTLPLMPSSLIRRMRIFTRTRRVLSAKMVNLCVTLTLTGNSRTVFIVKGEGSLPNYGDTLFSYTYVLFSVCLTMVAVWQPYNKRILIINIDSIHYSGGEYRFRQIAGIKKWNHTYRYCYITVIYLHVYLTFCIYLRIQFEITILQCRQKTDNHVFLQ